MNPEFRQYGVSFTASNNGPKCYKQYRLGEKTFWRNYKRSVAGGITFMDLVDLKTTAARRDLGDQLSRTLYDT